MHHKRQVVVFVAIFSAMSLSSSSSSSLGATVSFLGLNCLDRSTWNTCWEALRTVGLNFSDGEHQRNGQQWNEMIRDRWVGRNRRVEPTASSCPNSLCGHSQSRYFRVISDLAFTPTAPVDFQDLKTRSQFLFIPPKKWAPGPRYQVTGGGSWDLALCTGKLDESVDRTKWACRQVDTFFSFSPVISILLVSCVQSDSLHWHKAESLLNSRLLNHKQVVVQLDAERKGRKIQRILNCQREKNTMWFFDRPS